jgi:hypothetical protein
MRSCRRGFLFLVCFCCVLGISGVGAEEFNDGRIRLVLHERTGRFSLYYLTDIVKEKYEPFFVDQDPRTSSLSVIVNDRTYRLGEASAFRVRIDGSVPSRPAIVFESSFLLITQEFSFIRNSSAALSGGIRMTVRIENKNEQQLAVGLRFLLDTYLGEKRSSPSFITDVRSIFSETVITTGDTDRWWVSRNDTLGLMGSIPGTEGMKNNFIHMANWKRLNDVPWKTGYAQGRNFNLLPYSVGDSAVCYYYEPVPLARGEERTVSIQLAVEDEGGFARYEAASNNQLSRLLQESVRSLSSGTPERSAGIPDGSPGTPGGSPEIPGGSPEAPGGSPETPGVYPVPPAGPDGRADPRWVDLITVRDLLNQLDAYMAAGGTVSEEELAAIELIINRLQSRYTIP